MSSYVFWFTILSTILHGLEIREISSPLKNKDNIITNLTEATVILDLYQSLKLGNASTLSSSPKNLTANFPQIFKQSLIENPKFRSGKVEQTVCTKNLTSAAGAAHFKIDWLRVLSNCSFPRKRRFGDWCLDSRETKWYTKLFQRPKL